MTDEPGSTTYASGRKRLTPAQEDYLKALFKLQEDHELVSTSELAQRLAISPASVSEMVNRLSSLGLVSHHRSHGQQLTPQGRSIAVELIRHHRLMEMFLVQVLGFGWDEVHEEAERLEHVISERMEARIFDLLGRPRIDPHGDSIPTLEGALEKSGDRTLESAIAGERLRVKRVSDEDPVKLRAIEELGLVPAVECEVTDGSRYESPIGIRVDGRPVSVPLGLARVIFVESA
ncbi:MAG TPA: metal-dependent transcriptional regulator [Candidatus Dormibacteraeota bacterium]|jgi:DtxR family Mn-dependent transcriptional regulator|nr:metal-dependent transcriptional regulator [Candidatus Dormibacteraeota bacterium]